MLDSKNIKFVRDNILFGVGLVLTTITITGFFCMVVIIIAVITGHYSGRRPNTGVLDALILSGTVIPIGIAIAAIPLYNIAIYDWPSSAYLLPPQFAILAAALVGGVLGFKSGESWRLGEGSCFYCLASFASVLMILSVVIVLYL